MTTLICDFQDIVGKKIDGYATLTAGKVRPSYDSPSLVVHNPTKQRVEAGQTTFANVNPGEAVITLEWDEQSATIRFVVPDSDDAVYLSDTLSGEYLDPDELELLRWSVQNQLSGAREILENAKNLGLTAINGSAEAYFTEAAEILRKALEAAHLAESYLGTIDGKVAATEGAVADASEARERVESLLEDMRLLQIDMDNGSLELETAINTVNEYRPQVEAATKAVAEATALAESAVDDLMEVQGRNAEEFLEIKQTLDTAVRESEQATKDLALANQAVANEVQRILGDVRESLDTATEATNQARIANDNLETYQFQMTAIQEEQGHILSQQAEIVGNYAGYTAELERISAEISSASSELDTISGEQEALVAEMNTQVGSLQELTAAQGAAIGTAKARADKGVNDAAAASNALSAYKKVNDPKVVAAQNAADQAKADATSKSKAAREAAEEYAREAAEAAQAQAEETAAAEALRIAQAEATAAKNAAATDAQAKADEAERLAKIHADAQAKSAKETAEANAAKDASTKADKAKTDAQAAAKVLSDKAQQAAATAKARADKGVADAATAKARADKGVTDAATALAKANEANNKLPAITSDVSAAAKSALDAVNALPGIRTDISTAKQQADKGVQDAATAKSAVDNLQIGGRNLVQNSKLNLTTTSYNMVSETHGQTLRLPEDTPLVDGEEVTVSIKGQLGKGKSSFAVYNSGGSYVITTLTPSHRGADGVYRRTTTWNGATGSSNTHSYIYQAPSSVTVESTIEWIKIERGNKATDWSPAPEDVDAGITTAQRGANNAIIVGEALANPGAEVTPKLANGDPTWTVGKAPSSYRPSGAPTGGKAWHTEHFEDPGTWEHAPGVTYDVSFWIQHYKGDSGGISSHIRYGNGSTAHVETVNLAAGRTEFDGSSNSWNGVETLGAWRYVAWRFKIKDDPAIDRLYFRLATNGGDNAFRIYDFKIRSSTPLSIDLHKTQADTELAQSIASTAKNTADKGVADAATAKSAADTAKARADKGVSDAATAKSAADNARAQADKANDLHMVQDTRNDAELPHYYWENYARLVVKELKQGLALGVGSGYGTLTTNVPWTDSSGGAISQTFVFNNGGITYVRRSRGSRAAATWSEWVNEIGEINSKISTLNSTAKDLTTGLSNAATQKDYNDLNTRLWGGQGEINTLQGEINANNSAFQTWQKTINDRRDIWEDAHTKATQALGRFAITQSQWNELSKEASDANTKAIKSHSALFEGQNKWNEVAAAAIKTQADFATKQKEWNAVQKKVNDNFQDWQNAAKEMLADTGKFQVLQKQFNSDQKKWNATQNLVNDKQKGINALNTKTDDAQTLAIQGLSAAVSLSFPHMNVAPDAPTGDPWWSVGMSVNGNFTPPGFPDGRSWWTSSSSIVNTDPEAMITVVPGIDYKISFWTARVDAGTAGAYVDLRDSSGRTVVSDWVNAIDGIPEEPNWISGSYAGHVLPTHTNWIQRTYLLRVKPGVDKVALHFRPGAGATRDGTRVRFWGVHLSAYMPVQEQIDSAQNTAIEALNRFAVKQADWNKVSSDASDALKAGQAAQKELNTKRDRWEDGVTLALNNLQTTSTKFKQWTKASADASAAQAELEKKRGDWEKGANLAINNLQTTSTKYKQWSDGASLALANLQTTSAKFKQWSTGASQALDALERAVGLERMGQSLISYTYATGYPTWTRNTTRITTGLPSGVSEGFTAGSAIRTLDISGPYIPVLPDTPYRVRFWARAAKAGSNFYIEMRDQTGELAPIKNTMEGSQDAYIAGNIRLTTGWKLWEGTVTFSENTKEVRLNRVYWNHPNGVATTQYIAGLEIFPDIPSQDKVDEAQNNAIDALQAVLGLDGEGSEGTLMGQVGNLGAELDYRLRHVNEDLRTLQANQWMTHYWSTTGGNWHGDAWFNVTSNSNGSVDITAKGSWVGVATVNAVRNKLPPGEYTNTMPTAFQWQWGIGSSRTYTLPAPGTNSRETVQSLIINFRVDPGTAVNQLYTTRDHTPVGTGWRTLWTHTVPAATTVSADLHVGWDAVSRGISYGIRIVVDGTPRATYGPRNDVGPLTSFGNGYRTMDVSLRNQSIAAGKTVQFQVSSASGDGARRKVRDARASVQYTY